MPKILSGDNTAGIVDAGLGFRHGTGNPTWTAGAGSPEGAVTAVVGSLWSRIDGGTNTAVYRKEVGSGNTGWVATSSAATDLWVDVAGDTMTGNLGLGFPSPTSKLQFAADTVAAGGILFGTDTNLYRLAPDTLRTDDSLQVGLYGMKVNPTTGHMVLGSNSDPATNSSILILGGTGMPTNFASTGAVTGINAIPVNSDVGSITGSTVQPVSTIASGTVSALNGVSASVRLASAAGTATDGRAYNAASPTITAGGTIVNAYGLDIAAQKVTGVTNAYGVYQRGTTDTNRFDGYLVANNSGATIGHSSTLNTTAAYLTIGNAGGAVQLNSASQTYGIRSIPSNRGTGDHTGIDVQPLSTGGTSVTVSQLTSANFSIWYDNTTSTLTSGRSLKVSTPNIKAGSTVTTMYGLDIQDQKPAGVTTSYGIYQRGASDANYFAGEVRGNIGFRQGASGPTWSSGTGSPEGVVAAPVGSIFSRTDGGIDTTFYRKEVGSGNTGWVTTAAGGAVASVDGRTGTVVLSDLYVNVTGDTMTGALTFADGANIVAGTTTGTKIGTGATQKIGFWNAAPVVQNTGWSVTAGYTAQRSFNPEAASLYDVARTLGTLVDQLKTYGLVGA
jgi:hypothetical protein